MVGSSVLQARARAGVTATTPPLLAGKLAKLGELAELPGALGTGVGVILGTADLRVVTGGPRGVVSGVPAGDCFKVCFCNKSVLCSIIAIIICQKYETPVVLFVRFICLSVLST